MRNKEFFKQLGLKLIAKGIMVELSVKDVTNKSGLHPVTIQKIEKGAKDFHILNLRLALV